jgi:hypothetical protein
MHFILISLAILLLALTGCTKLLPQTVGSPFGNSLRAGDYIATLIYTQQPYLPSLHRNPENDRFRIGLLLHPIDGGAPLPLIPIAADLRFSDFQHTARMLGSDGRFVWFIAHDIGAYDLQRRRLINVDHLRRANPSLAGLWQNARYSFGRRMQVISHDYAQEFEIDPSTLQAVPSPGIRRAGSAQALSQFAARYRSEQYYKPAPIRASSASDPLRLSGPDGHLIGSRTKPGLDSTLTLARVDTTGKNLWTVDTGIADLDQILADPVRLAFIGKKPRIPGKVQEPILVIVNSATGEISTRSLWQR